MKWILLFLVLWALLQLWAWYSRKWMARRIVESVRANFGGRHEYRDVAPEKFPHLDLAWYDETAGLFEEEGFVRLGDVENVTMNESPHSVGSTFIRGLSGDEGRIVVGIYHVVPNASVRGVQEARVVDLETAFSDGRFLVTSDATLAGAMSRPSAISCEFISGVPPLVLLATHRHRLNTFLAENPEVSVERLETQAQALEMAHRMEDLKAEHRRSEGGVLTLDELRKMVGHKMPEPELRKLAAEVARLREPVGGS